MAEPNEIELILEPQEEGGYHVYAPELPGLHTQGDDLDEAIANAEEARRNALVVPLHKEIRKGLGHRRICDPKEPRDTSSRALVWRSAHRPDRR